MIRSKTLALLAAAALPLGLSVLGADGADAQQISLRDSFRLGSGAGTLCTAQVAANDPAQKDMFDRAYAIVCRDAAVPVGQLYALRDRGEDPAARLAALRADKATCQTTGQEQLEGLGAVDVAQCTMTDAGVGYRVYSTKRGNTLFVAEGLAGYDSALELALRTVVADRPVPGEVAIAVTEAGDPAAFARVQAGALDPSRALAEAYRRNNAGNYAEAAEFFGALLRGGDTSAQGEAVINQAIQESNLGNYTEANALFARAAAMASDDPVMARMVRNYRTMHLLNLGRPQLALAELDKPLPRGMGTSGAQLREGVIDAETAARLNSETSVSRQLAASSSAGLLPEDKAEILDGQAEQLRGTIYRLQKRPDRAAAALNAAIERLGGVRGGRVTSTAWLRAQMLQELASIAEEGGNRAEAERQHLAAVALLNANYPNSARFLNTQARLAAFYTRTGQTAEATALFRQIVDANATSGNASPTLRRTLAPYFALLAAQGTPEATADMFKASQVLVRPGVAQTQAVLARELSGGSDEASRLFRQSVNLTRDIERTRVEISRLSALPQPMASETARLAELQPQLASLEREQVATQAKLADFPRYRVVSGGAMTLAELQEVLREGEAYYKMMVVGDNAYAIFATPQTARTFKLGATPAQLDKQVDDLRNTISTLDENGQLVTYPFNAELAHDLYRQLFQPIEGEVAPVRHLIFEPDGAMLRLPANLLVMERAGVDAYLAKARRPNDDGFDFTGIKWLGADRDISTAVSARGFRDVRRVERSQAPNDYIGFGENAVPSGEMRTAAATRSLMGGATTCEWGIQEWTRPISSEELRTASQVLGGGMDTRIVTGEEFTDTRIKSSDDLSKYRIMHFATHGLVTAPRPDCPARPALMTSFGGEQSDGLLTFAEIFDLKIDADLVILSACDTAGKATVAATQEAGLTTGGDQALDGLVRAFVGAGGRSVIASHWPVPDDYDATKRLISGLFTAPAGTPTATAMRTAQQQLMNAPETSHPYYWSAFAIIGDGADPVIRAEGGAAAAGN